MTGKLLYQWSTAAQLISVLMIALFFLALARSVKRAEVGAWAVAWGWDFVALAVTVVYWFYHIPALDAPLRGLFFGAKLAYALLLVAGARSMSRPGSTWIRPRTVAIICAAAALGSALALSTIDGLGVSVQLTLALLFMWCGTTLAGESGVIGSWLAWGFLARGLLALFEGVAYASDMLPAGMLSASTLASIQLFLGASSSIDLAAEWVLALGGVLAVTNRTQSEVVSANADLLTAQEQLRNVADRDPLTALANRRALPDAFRAVYESGASLVFCDLDNFKIINDTFGHAMGDACLLRFATAFRASFRPEDVIVRYAGDEFVAVCGGMDLTLAHSRVDALRAQLDNDPETPGIQFSAGVVELAAHESADTALLAADKAMYDNKKARVTGRLSRPSITQRMSGAITSEMVARLSR